MTAICPMFEQDLSCQNTMALQCTAKAVIKLTDTSQILPAIDFAKEQNLPIVILSGGSNVLLPVRLNALVLIPDFFGVDIVQQSDEKITIKVQAGESWHSLVEKCLKNGWYGLENLALIPGLVGASPVQNIGAYGVQVSDFIQSVIAFDLSTGEKIIFDHQACQFAYRDSVFKQNPNRYLITEVVFCLYKTRDHIVANYGDVAQVALEFAKKNARSQILAEDVFQAVIKIRQEKLPNPKELANCGSFFKNPIISLDKFYQLQQKFANLPSYAVDEHCIKVPAGFLIDKAGLKGQGVMPITTHKNQALVLVNHHPKNAIQDDVDNTQTLIINKIQEMFDITLEREPVWLDMQGQTL